MVSMNQQVEIDAHVPNARKSGVPVGKTACTSTHGNVTSIKKKGSLVTATCGCCSYRQRI